jgi:hypothetical protein
MRANDLRPFYVNIKNTSDKSQALYTRGEHDLSSIMFEVEDEKRNKNILKKIIPVTRSNMDIYQYISPGDIRKFKIEIDEDEWNNAFKLYKKGARKLRARAVFLNGSKKIYSEYYEIIIK